MNSDFVTCNECNEYGFYTRYSVNWRESSIVTCNECHEYVSYINKELYSYIKKYSQYLLRVTRYTRYSIQTLGEKDIFVTSSFCVLVTLVTQNLTGWAVGRASLIPQPIGLGKTEYTSRSKIFNLFPFPLGGRGIGERRRESRQPAQRINL